MADKPAHPRSSAHVGEKSIHAPNLERYMIVVSKKHGNPQIHYYLTEDGLQLGMTLDQYNDFAVKASIEDFIQAAVESIGNPAILFTKSGLEKRLRQAFTHELLAKIINDTSTEIIDEIKRASLQNPPPLQE